MPPSIIKFGFELFSFPALYQGLPAPLSSSTMYPPPPLKNPLVLVASLLHSFFPNLVPPLLMPLVRSKSHIVLPCSQASQCCAPQFFCESSSLPQFFLFPSLRGRLPPPLNLPVSIFVPLVCPAIPIFPHVARSFKRSSVSFPVPPPLLVTDAPRG